MTDADPPPATGPRDAGGALLALRAAGRALLARPRPFWAVVAVLWIALIWYLSSQSMERAPAGPLWRFLANGVHVPMFGLLALWLALAIPRSETWPRLELGASVLVVVLVSAYGGIDEWHQSWSGRSPSVSDWVTDSVAATWVVVVAAHVGSTSARRVGVSRLFWGGLGVCLGAVALATWA